MREEDLKAKGVLQKNVSDRISRVILRSKAYISVIELNKTLQLGEQLK